MTLNDIMTADAVAELLVHRLTLIDCFTFVPAVFSRQMLHNGSNSQPLSACPECVGNEHAAGIHRPVFSRTSFQAQHDAMLHSLDTLYASSCFTCKCYL